MKQKRKAKKGQAIIDTVVLFLVVAVVLVTMYVYVGERSIAFQSVRYESSLHQSALTSILNYYFDITYARGTLADLLIQSDCSSINLQSDLSKKVKEKLNLINSKKDRHYILYAEDSQRSRTLLHVFDNYSTVCMDDIALARWEVKGSCSDGNQVSIEVVYGSWPYWKKVRPVC